MRGLGAPVEDGVTEIEAFDEAGYEAAFEAYKSYLPEIETNFLTNIDGQEPDAQWASAFDPQNSNNSNTNV